MRSITYLQAGERRSCFGCHDGKEGDMKSALVLTGEHTEQFTRSYDDPKTYVRWYEWGGRTINEIATKPGHAGADESPLSKVLHDTLHAKHVQLPQEDLRRLYIWLDANAPFYGTYDKQQQLA